MTSNYMKYLLLIYTMLLSPWLSATSSDSSQALHIEADSVEIRERQGISIYQGHVSITRGSMLINGQLIQVSATNDNEYVINVEGTPARFKQLNSNNVEVSAQSLKMIFTSATGILIMDNKAVLIQGANQFTSEHIIYNTRQDIVQAGDSDTTSGSKETKRVTITIQPKQEQNTTRDQTK